jgi:hypothetical protein
MCCLVLVGPETVASLASGHQTLSSPSQPSLPTPLFVERQEWGHALGGGGANSGLDVLNETAAVRVAKTVGVETGVGVSRAGRETLLAGRETLLAPMVMSVFFVMACGGLVCWGLFLSWGGLTHIEFMTQVRSEVTAALKSGCGWVGPPAGAGVESGERGRGGSGRRGGGECGGGGEGAEAEPLREAEPLLPNDTLAERDDISPAKLAAVRKRVFWSRVHVVWHTERAQGLANLREMLGLDSYSPRELGGGLANWRAPAHETGGGTPRLVESVCSLAGSLARWLLLHDDALMMQLLSAVAARLLAGVCVCVCVCVCDCLLAPLCVSLSVCLPTMSVSVSAY